MGEMLGSNAALRRFVLQAEITQERCFDMSCDFLATAGILKNQHKSAAEAREKLRVSLSLLAAWGQEAEARFPARGQPESADEEEEAAGAERADGRPAERESYQALQRAAEALLARAAADREASRASAELAADHELAAMERWRAGAAHKRAIQTSRAAQEEGEASGPNAAVAAAAEAQAREDLQQAKERLRAAEHAEATGASARRLASAQTASAEAALRKALDDHAQTRELVARAASQEEAERAARKAARKRGREETKTALREGTKHRRTLLSDMVTTVCEAAQEAADEAASAERAQAIFRKETLTRFGCDDEETAVNVVEAQAQEQRQLAESLFGPPAGRGAAA